MTQNFQRHAHLQTKVNQRHEHSARAQVRAHADAVLRDIAFVLKMTERVRTQIEAEQEAAEPVTV